MMKILAMNTLLLLLCAALGQAQSLKAVTGADQRIILGQPVQFDAAKSTVAPGRRIQSYQWDFDNLDGLTNNHAGVSATYYYNQVGSYTATLTVTDDQGQTARAWQRIEVLSPSHWGPTLVDRFEGGRTGVIAKGRADFSFYNQWGLQWYFRLDNVANAPISIQIFGYGPQRKVPPSVTPYDDDQSFDQSFVPYVNYDFAHPKWERLVGAKLEYDARTSSLVIRHTFKQSPVYLAWSPPYLPSDLDRFTLGLQGNAFAKAEVIGKSVEGRDLKLLTVTDPETPDRNKRAVWFIGQQHGYEMAGGPVCEGTIRELLNGARSAEVLKKFVFKFVPIVNPDAMAHGGFRYNLRDVDLNRNWDEAVKHYADRLQPEPEVAAVQQALAQWVEQGNRLDLFVDLHCHTPLSDGLWVYPAEQALVGDKLYQRQIEFAQHFLSRKYRFSISSPPIFGSALWYVATKYGNRTGALAYTSENPLLTIRTAAGKKLLTTPELYRDVGREWVRAILDYFR